VIPRPTRSTISSCGQVPPLQVPQCVIAKRTLSATPMTCEPGDPQIRPRWAAQFRVAPRRPGPLLYHPYYLSAVGERKCRDALGQKVSPDEYAALRRRSRPASRRALQAERVRGSDAGTHPGASAEVDFVVPIALGDGVIDERMRTLAIRIRQMGPDPGRPYRRIFKRPYSIDA